jgi:6-phosphogluconolactonase
MLTGGRSAECLYLAWSALPDFKKLGGVHFYFGDERIVPSTHLESNYGLVMRTLFNKGIPDGCSIVRMEVEHPNRDEVSMAYEKKLPGKLDILLLSVGEDGHIASLFPHGEGLNEASRSIVPVSGPKPPNDRLTITPIVIARARKVFVLAIGAKKKDILRRARVAPHNFADLPARLVLGATWLLD